MKERQNYSPIQPKMSCDTPSPQDFPPFFDRVSQDNPIPLQSLLKHYRPERVTIQTSDVCQLECPGCYVSQWTHKDGNVRAGHGSLDADGEILESQLSALGNDVDDYFYLGVEPTLRPEVFHKVQSFAEKAGATVMSITNGASRTENYDKTFHSSSVQPPYKINISLDSIDYQINNRLRGKSFATQATLKTIDHAVEMEDPIKVNLTVWPDNYATVLETIENLFDRGVRAFAFHCGSVEGIAKNAALSHLDPLAWRALCAELIQFRDAHLDALADFTVPYIFFNENELKDGILGDEQSYEDYKSYLLRNDSSESNPVKVCPALDVPQVYLFANDGKEQNGAISLCNIHTVGINAGNESDVYFAEYDKSSSEFIVQQDTEKNELVRMYESRHLCPAAPYAMGVDMDGDSFATAAGEVYHACRYVSLNQFPFAEKDFGKKFYSKYAEFYTIWNDVISSDKSLIPLLKAIDTNNLDAAIIEISSIAKACHD